MGKNCFLQLLDCDKKQKLLYKWRWPNKYGGNHGVGKNDS